MKKKNSALISFLFFVQAVCIPMVENALVLQAKRWVACEGNLLCQPQHACFSQLPEKQTQWGQFTNLGPGQSSFSGTVLEQDTGSMGTPGDLDAALHLASTVALKGRRLLCHGHPAPGNNLKPHSPWPWHEGQDPERSDKTHGAKREQALLFQKCPLAPPGHM